MKKFYKQEIVDANYANAQLIAAAPEMLAALERVELGVFGSMLSGSDIEVCTRSARLAVQAAIAKARGNQ